jgi:hypothetical protein
MPQPPGEFERAAVPQEPWRFAQTDGHLTASSWLLDLVSRCFDVGPNFLAPQSTAQSDHELKYDGTKLAGSHVIRYGVAFNHIQGFSYGSYLQYGPRIVSTVSTAEVVAAATGPFPGGASSPLNYPADSITIANGLGYFTSQPVLGFPASGLGPDNRILAYLGDSWKIMPNFNITYGLRWGSRHRPHRQPIFRIP